MYEFFTLIREVCLGNKEAWTILKKNFKEKKYSLHDQELIHIYLKKNASRYNHAIYIRAWLYDYGYGVPEDKEMAFLLMREAASFSHKKAMFEVGKRFLTGCGVDQNYNNALQWFILAASSPYYHPGAMYQTGLMYQKGLGTPVNLNRAEYWFGQARLKNYKPKL